MPRELYLAAPREMTFDDLAGVMLDIDPTLTVREFGPTRQLVDTDDVAVLTIDASRLIDDPGPVVAIMGPISLTGPVWWTEATAPWGPAGLLGIRLARELAWQLHADLHVVEGS
jgi:hypothetical protein